jgi:type II secretory pathway component GspD/PulD (secretin)
MQPLQKFGFILAIFITLPVVPAIAQTDVDEYYRQWIDYRNGEISVAFEDTPLQFALHAFHARTGFQIVVPTPIERKVVSLRIDRQPLEPAVRSLISTIGFRNFALMYDDKGQPRQAVVLGTQPVPAAPNAESVILPLSEPEKDRLKKDLERWSELKQEDRGKIEDRLKSLPSSDDREVLVREYGRQLLAAK